jgi:hypothetical protein
MRLAHDGRSPELVDEVLFAFAAHEQSRGVPLVVPVVRRDLALHLPCGDLLGHPVQRDPPE